MIAARLREEPLSAAYSSDLIRARETAEIIASQHRGLSVILTPLLREAFFGEWEGLTRAELGELFPEEFERYTNDPIGNRAPGGEKLEDVTRRCREFLQMVVATHTGGNVLVVGHGGSLRGIICAALGLPLTFYRQIRVDNAGLTIMEIYGDHLAAASSGFATIACLNDTCHLG